MDLRYMDSTNIVHKPEPKQLIMAYDYAKEVSVKDNKIMLTEVT